MCKSCFQTRNGFTIVELLIMLILIGVVFAILSLLVYLPIRNTDFTQKQYMTFEEMRKIVEIMRRELTLAESATATNVVPLNINDKQLIFYASDKGFHIKTKTTESTISSLKLQCRFEVNANSSSPPPKPKQRVKVSLKHDNPAITLEATIGLLNSMNLSVTSESSGTVLIVQK